MVPYWRLHLVSDVDRLVTLQWLWPGQHWCVEVYIAEPRNTFVPASIATWFMSPLDDDKRPERKGWLVATEWSSYSLIKILLYWEHCFVGIPMRCKYPYICFFFFHHHFREIDLCTPFQDFFGTNFSSIPSKSYYQANPWPQPMNWYIGAHLPIFSYIQNEQSSA